MARQRSSRRFLGSAAAAILLAAAAAAQNWTSVGPPGGTITALAVSPLAPQRVFAGARSGGLYRSLDGGGTWAPAAVSEIGGDTVNALAIDPDDAAVVWAGTESKGVLRSGDGGTTWTPMSAGLPSYTSRYPEVLALAVDPANLSLVLAGLGANPVGGKPMVYRTGNAGQTWTETTGAGFEDQRINDLTFGAGVAFAATDFKGVWVSEDGGLTWEHVGDDTLDGTSVEALAVDESTAPPRLFIALSDSVYTATPPASPAPVSARRASKWAVAVFLYAASYGFKYNRAILIALEKGEFPPKPEPTPAPGAVARAAVSEAPVIYTGTLTSGVQRSIDGGASWAAYNGGLDPVEVDELAAADGTLFAGTDGSGVWRRTAGAPGWTRSSAGLLATTVTAIAVDPAHPATLYAGTEGGGVLKSIDAGVTWNPVGFATMVVNAFDPWVADVAVDPSDPSVVYALIDRYLFRSENAGASWTRYTLPSGIYANDLLVFPNGGSTVLWAGGSGGVVRSGDGGKTWTRPDPTFTQNVQALAGAPATPQTLYAGTYSSGVYKSTNDGVSWGPVNNDGGSGFLTNGHVSALAVDPKAPDTVYAGVDGHALYKTSNGGVSWENLTDGLLDQASFTFATLSSIAVHPTNTQTLFASAAGSNFSSAVAFLGVYRSNDGGAHWTKFGNGLSSTETELVIFDPTTPNRLYAGTRGRGAFRYGSAPPAATARVRTRLGRP